MARVLFSNNARSSLAFAISESETAIVLEDASNFPEPVAGSGDWFTVTLESFTVGQEILRCTLREGNLLHVIRGQEGTTAKSFPAGTLLSNRITAGSLSARIDAQIYDNTASTLEANTVKEAIDELDSKLVGAVEQLTQDISVAVESANKKTISTQAPDGIPEEGEEWIVVAE